MLLKEKDFELFENKLNEVLKRIEETNDTGLSFNAWLEESRNTEEEHYYNRICFSYKLPVGNIDSSSQSDGYFYDTNFIKDNSIDMTYINLTEDVFKRLISQAEKIEKQIEKIDEFSNHYDMHEILIHEDSFFELEDLPALVAKFYIQGTEPIIVDLEDVNLDTFK